MSAGGGGKEVTWLSCLRCWELDCFLSLPTFCDPVIYHHFQAPDTVSTVTFVPERRKSLVYGVRYLFCAGLNYYPLAQVIAKFYGPTLQQQAKWRSWLEQPTVCFSDTPNPSVKTLLGQIHKAQNNTRPPKKPCIIIIQQRRAPKGEGGAVAKRAGPEVEVVQRPDR